MRVNLMLEVKEGGAKKCCTGCRDTKKNRNDMKLEKFKLIKYEMRLYEKGFKFVARCSKN